MEIKNAKYNKHDISGENISINCQIDNRFCSVPINEENRDYKEIDNPHSKPSEADCTAGLKALQDAWDLENDSYKSKRRAEYPSIKDQLDDIYHNGIDAWKATIKTTKDKYPKG